MKQGAGVSFAISIGIHVAIASVVAPALIIPRAVEKLFVAHGSRVVSAEVIRFVVAPRPVTQPAPEPNLPVATRTGVTKAPAPEQSSMRLPPQAAPNAPDLTAPVVSAAAHSTPGSSTGDPDPGRVALVRGEPDPRIWSLGPLPASADTSYASRLERGLVQRSRRTTIPSPSPRRERSVLNG